MYRKNCLERSMLSNTKVSQNVVGDKKILSVLNKNKSNWGAFYLVGGIKCKVWDRFNLFKIISWQAWVCLYLDCQIIKKKFFVNGAPRCGKI